MSIEHPPLERAYTLITAQDIPGKNELAGFPVPILASGELSYLGEPVAILAGPDRMKLESYAGQCRVILQEESPVFAAPASGEDPGPESSGPEAGSPPPMDPPAAGGQGGPGEPAESAAEGTIPALAAPAAGAPTAPVTQTPSPAAPPAAGETKSPDRPSAAPPAEGVKPAPVPGEGADPAEFPAERGTSGAEPAQAQVPGGGRTKAASPPVEPEIFLERLIDRGDIEAAFTSAREILGGVYSTGIQEHAYGEAVGALVEYLSGPSETKDEGERILVIHTATQWPRHVSRSAAQVLGLEESQIITEATDPGLPMDGKIWYPSLIGCQAALTAVLTRRNIRLLLSREEDFCFSPKRNASRIGIQSALGEEGEILGTKIDLTLDLGAQAVFGEEILDQSCLAVLGIAGQGALSLRARAIRTNIPPQGPFGGFGAAQGSFALERHSSRIADSRGLDPAGWRRDHYPRKKTPSRASLEQVLDTVAAMADYYRKWGSYELLRRRRREDQPSALPEVRRGIGIALGRQGKGFLHIDESEFSVEVTLHIDGSLEIRSSVKAGKELIHLWADIARETLGVEEDKVRVVSRNTALCPDSGPESLSRTIGAVTPLVEQSCQAIRNQRFRDPLPITVEETAGQPVLPRNFPIKVPNPGSLGNPGWAAAVVELEIGPHSYSPVIRGIWLAVDGGRILSEKRARRILKLAGIQALGWASGEYLEYRRGTLYPSNVAAYGFLDPGEIPPIHIDFLRNDGAVPRGIGDLPFNCIPAAYIQAISQAADHPFEKIPLRPLDIWEVFNPKAADDPAGENHK